MDQREDDEAALACADLEPDVAETAVPLLHDLWRFEAGHDLHPSHVGDLGPDKSHRHLVITSGSGYSGTGAVTDFLAQASDVSMPLAKHELSALKASHGVAALLASPSRAELAAFVRACVIGIPHEPELGPHERHRVQYQALSRTMRKNPQAAGCLFASAQQLLREFETDERAALSRFLNHALRVKGRTPHLYFNNVIHQNSIHIFGLLRNATCLAIIRDARDQYISRCLESKHDRISPERYVSRRRRHARRFWSYPHPGIFTYRFEDFVTSPATRSDVLAVIRADDLEPDLSVFDPSRSQQNVGLWRTWGDREAVALIERELPRELYSPQASRPDR